MVVAAEGAVSLDGEAGFALKPPDLEVLSGKKSRKPVVIPKRPSAQALEDAAGNSRGLRLAGRGEKIHEKVCRYGGRVPIREVWRARAMTAAVRRVLGLSETLGTCASSASNETRRS